MSKINYPYFALFFFSLVITAASSIFLKDSLSGSKTFFFLYATGQAFLETSILAFLSIWLPRYLGKKLFFSFIGFTFLLLIMHWIDFFMDRILDLTVFETIQCFLLNETFSHFLYLLDASGVALWIWFVAFLALLGLPFLGIFFYQMLQKLADRNPVAIRSDFLFKSFLCIPFALMFWDVTASRNIHPDSYTSFIKSLPWKWTFLQPKTVHLELNHPFFPPATEEEKLKKIASDTTVLNKKPNIYLFIIESLREDCITQEIAPHLHQFKDSACHFDFALSNGNGSHLSWFSIFHSEYPYLWNYPEQMDWKKGSPALNLLKKWGYQIRLYTSAQLGYYDMEKILFGQNQELIDSLQTFHHTTTLSAAETDRQALQKMQKDLEEHPELKQGQCIIFFLDSTHFHYSWPKDFPTKFSPFSTEVGYFHLMQSDQKIEEIKNRYKNAVAYVDSLFGDFQEKLDQKEAIVVVTGDHAEEFFEHGHLFHGSHLIHEQTHIPLYIKLGQTRWQDLPKVASQIDIFPTILHYLSGKEIDFLKGRSIFTKDPMTPYAVIARFNAGRSPQEFCLHNGENKLTVQFYEKDQIFRSKHLTIRSVRNAYDEPLMQNSQDLQKRVNEEFIPLLEDMLHRQPR